MIKLILLICCLAHFTARAENLTVPGGAFELRWQSEFSSEEKNKLRNWLGHAASATAQLNGKFPAPITTILIQTAKAGRGPVPWANTIRHTRPQGVSFHVNPAASLDDFLTDWTATHEFSHLFLPYPGRADIWLSEGFASYYQYILMMRHGTLSDESGWQKIAAGFARGARDPNQNVSLDIASQEMRSRRAHKRVYWSGAHYFLEIDIALRRSGSSLDAVITRFNACCRGGPGKWDGPRLAAALDKAAALDNAAEQPLFLPLFRHYEQATQLPDYEQTLVELGVELNGQEVTLNVDALYSDLRRAISAAQ